MDPERGGRNCNQDILYEKKNILIKGEIFLIDFLESIATETIIIVANCDTEPFFFLHMDFCTWLRTVALPKQHLIRL